MLSQMINGHAARADRITRTVAPTAGFWYLGDMRRFALVMSLLCLTACGAGPADRSYAGTARYRYEQGVEALADDDFIEAIKHFTFVKNKFAYSKYAALAEMGMANTYFAENKYLLAVDSYRTFIQGRPNHREVPFAMWRIGESYFEQRPSGFFLFPPPYEKDMAATKDALRSLSQYVERFPRHEKIKQAKSRIADCRRALASYELYVAGFYLRQDRPMSARGRLEVLVKDFRDVADLWSDAAYRLIEVYLDLKKPVEAVQTAKLLIELQPKSDEADEARAFLRAIKSK